MELSNELDLNTSNGSNNGLNSVLKMEDYSEKSFVVYGTEEYTRKFKDQLKSLGARFNGRLKQVNDFPGGPAWIFPMSQKDKVSTFLSQVNTGEWEDGRRIIFEEENGEVFSIPTVLVPSKKTTFQKVRWSVFKPSEGMKTVIKIGSQEIKGEVAMVENHKDITDTVYVKKDDSEDHIKLVICNGRWMVWGYAVDHSVHFN